MLQLFSVSGACDPDTDFLKERVIMETKKVKLDAGLLAGILMALLTVRNVVNFVRILRFQFSFSGLVAAAASGFVAAVLLMKRRDKLLLIALGVFALDQMIWGSIVSFVSIAILLLIALVMTTEYLPQAKALAEKVWFVPAILTFIGSFIGIRYFIFATLGWALISCAAVLLCGFWLAFPERDVAELFAAVKVKAGAAASTIGDTTIAEAEVDGYCDLFKQVLLMMITFGIWFFIWIYRMTRYLNRVGGEDKRTPVKQLLLCLFVPLVAGIVPHILMQGKINEIITFENSVVVAPVEEIAEECEEN